MTDNYVFKNLIWKFAGLNLILSAIGKWYTFQLLSGTLFDYHIQNQRNPRETLSQIAQIAQKIIISEISEIREKKLSQIAQIAQKIINSGISEIREKHSRR